MENKDVKFKETVASFSINVSLIIWGIALIVTGAVILGLLHDGQFKENILNGIKIVDCGLFDIFTIIAGYSIVLGILLTIYVSVAFCCAYGYRTETMDSMKNIAITYAIFGFILLFATAVFCALSIVMKTMMNDIGKEDLVQNLHREFKEGAIDTNDKISNSWNEMFMKLHCCAVNPVVSTVNDFDQTPWCTTSGECQQTNSQIPKTCCKGFTVSNYFSAPSACHANVDSGTYYPKGCYEPLMEEIRKYINVLIFFAIPVIILEIAFGTIAFVSAYKKETFTEVLRVALPAVCLCISIGKSISTLFDKKESYVESTQMRDIERFELESNE